MYNNVKKKYKKKANIYIKVNFNNEKFNNNNKPTLFITKLNALIRF